MRAALLKPCHMAHTVDLHVCDDQCQDHCHHEPCLHPPELAV
jgi:hypothetical protein